MGLSKFAWCTGALMTLAACGGGGGGGSSASTPVVTKTSQDSLAIGASLAICGTGEKPLFFGFYRP